MHDPAGETIGDIIARALRGDAVPPALDPGRVVANLLADCSGPTNEPEPEAYWWPMLNEDGTCRGTVVVDGETWGRLAMARLLAPDMARHFGVPVAAVLTALSVLSANLNGCMDSAQGWSLLGEYVGAATGGSVGDYYRPSVH